jgi:hypothetical protein
VDVGRVAVGAEAGDELLAFVDDPVAVGVGELPDAGRGADVEGAAVPERAHREREPVRHDDALVELPVAVGVLEPDHPVGRPLQEVLEPEVDAGGVADVQPHLLVEARHDGPLDERRGGDALDDEAVGDLDRRRVVLRRRGKKGERQDRSNHGFLSSAPTISFQIL